MAQDWTEKDFIRRHYAVEGGVLDKARRIELHVIVDGKPIVKMQAREPGMLAFVSRPNEQGFDIEVVQADKVRFTDSRTHTGLMTEPVENWQLQALGFNP